MKFIKVITAFLLSMVLGVAQAGLVEQWVTTYDHAGNFYDSLNGLALDTTGGVFVTGDSSDPVTGQDYATIKYDRETGAQLWVARYDHAADKDWPRGLAADAAGDVFVTGGSADPITSTDIATIKYDGETGAQLWVARYDYGFSDAALALALDAAGDVYVTGASDDDPDTPERDAVTVKYDGETGAQLWFARYNDDGNGSSRMYDLAVDAAGDVSVVGYIYNYDHPGADLATVKYDGETGAQLWVARYDHAGLRDDPGHITVDAAGNVIVTFLSEDPVTGLDTATIKYDGETGAQLWVARYDHAGLRDDPTDVVVDAAGDVYITGGSNDPVTTRDAATVKYDGETGAQLWVARYDYIGFGDVGIELALDAEGDVYIAGWSRPDVPDSADFITIKYDGETGEQLLVKRYDHDWSDGARYVMLDAAGDVYVAGDSTDLLETNSVYVTIKYAQDSDDDGIPDSSDNCPDDANSDQANNDGDSQGDICDLDDDNDTVLDDADNCPMIANADQANYDGDEQGDVCDPDDDNDGILDVDDPFPMSDTAPTVIIKGCDSGVNNQVIDGVSFSDLIGQCAETTSNHGQFVSCVTALATDWLQAGLINGRDLAMLVNAANGLMCR